MLQGLSTDVIPTISTTSIDDRLASSSSLPSQWDFINDVYLITTFSSNTDRLDQTKIQLEKVNLWDRVQIRKFQTDDEDRVRGCYTSHIKVLEEINQRCFPQETSGGLHPYRALVLEDNLELTGVHGREGGCEEVVRDLTRFVGDDPGGTRGSSNRQWDVIHLAYMMYVPNLNLQRINNDDDDVNDGSYKHIVQMIADKNAAVGTSAYLISSAGVAKVLQRHAERGYADAIPNVMSQLFPESRYAVYPMLFHRAGKISSLVNPQLNDFRKVMFSPSLYSNWERLMVTTGLQNNQLFPGLVASLLVIILSTLYSVVFADHGSSDSLGHLMLSSGGSLLAFIPLMVALWGSSLFKSGNTGMGFATTSTASTTTEKNK